MDISDNKSMSLKDNNNKDSEGTSDRDGFGQMTSNISEIETQNENNEMYFNGPEGDPEEAAHADDDKYVYSLQLTKKGTSMPVDLPKELDREQILNRVRNFHTDRVGLLKIGFRTRGAARQVPKSTGSPGNHGFV